MRRLWKNPTFTLAAVLTLGVAIGASTSTFSAVNGVLLRALPYPDPGRLVMLWGTRTASNAHREQICYPDIADIHKSTHSFEGVAMFSGFWFPAIAGPEGAEQIGGLRVSESYFNVMKSRFLLGRGFLPEEQWDGRGPVAVVSHDLWQRRLGSDPSIIGGKLSLSGRPYTIVGVLAPGEKPLPASVAEQAIDIYRPLSKGFSDEIRDGHHLRAIGRLKPGVTLGEAQAEVTAAAVALEKQFPDTNRGRLVKLAGLQADTVRKVAPALEVLQGCVVVVLLLACGNVANLLLAQFTARRRELAIRGALGARRGRLIQQMLAESIVLAILAGAAGFLIAVWSLPLIEALGAKVFPDIVHINLDWRVALFAAGVSLASGLLFGLAPALITSSDNLIDALKAGARGATGHAGGRLRNLLVVAEMAGALALVVCAGLLASSFLRLRGVYPGFEAKNVLIAQITLPGTRYPNPEDRQRFVDRLMPALSAIPGAVSAGAVTVLPESANFNQMAVDVEGRVLARPDQPSADQYEVTPDYFRTFSISLVSGRVFTAADDSRHQPVMILNETAARRLWPGENPLGRRARTGDPNEPYRTIVGVVGDVYQYGLDSPKTSQVYLPYAQNQLQRLSVLVRATRDPVSLTAPIRSAVNALDPLLPVKFSPMEQVMADSVAERRFSMIVMVAFGCCAVLLAAIGIYGVISYTVAQRTSEFGIRMALGAETRHILQMVMGGGAGWIALGLGLGLVAGLGITRYLSSLLFGVTARDPMTYAGAGILLSFVGLLASYLPARRATRVDPIVALRAE